jgi:ABC-2 type transport system ATP-binding protein/lipopolysaccharide transport system ATP-binding protein
MPNAIEALNITMKFNMSKERIENLKEYVIKFAKRQLHYEEFIALEDVSFSVEKGDVFGIVGLNGSGKSTLLKIISGILKPSSGRVYVAGSVAPLIELGAGFDMELTARENIYLNGSVLGHSKRFLDEHFDDIVDFSEMQDFLDVPMKNYSSGMVARVGFAIATMTTPEILIVDEILAVGDYKFQEKCERRIADMMSGGTTVLIVSHSIAQIERLCKHALWLESGRVKMIGDVRDVCATYQGKPLPNKRVVYTAILGDYDDLKTPRHVAEGWDYVCFTDNPDLKSDFWQIRRCEKAALIESGALHIDNPRRLGKFLKMKPHLLLPTYDESLWVDGSFEIVGDINEYIGTYLRDADMLCFSHPERDCIYDEAATCVAGGFALRSEADKQMSKYREVGIPEHFGLIAGGLLYRKHTDKLAELNDLWYNETMCGTPRDQLSFIYCCYTLDFVYDTCPLNYWCNPYFEYQAHKAEQNILNASLYIETRTLPFSEETVLRTVLGYPDGIFEIRFIFEAPYTDIARLRFDPGEEPVDVSIDEATLTDSNDNVFPLAYAGSNASDRTDGFDIFTHIDPNIYYIFPEACSQPAKEVVIKGRLRSRERMGTNAQ